MNKIGVDKLIKNGYIDEFLDEKVNVAAEIKKIKKEKNAIILAHYYQSPEVQDIADFIGDSLALAQIARKNSASIILIAGVYFMAETVKIISPEKKILIPDLNAVCSLADSCKYEDFKNFISLYPEHKVISYINTYASIKTLSYSCCTSSNALEIVSSLKNEKILFAPDYNLGSYIKKLTGNNDIILWNGACHVHKKFSLEKLLLLKEKFKNALTISHPECDNTILINSDFVGSTSQLIDFVNKSSKNIFLVATEPGVFHQMKKENKNKIFIPIPPEDSNCSCNECSFMKLITLKKIYLTLKYELPEIVLDFETIKKAIIPINRMFEITQT